jgi:hypothetical protein
MNRQHTDWCITCNPDAPGCRHLNRQTPVGGAWLDTCADCERTVVECPVCAPITYQHCAGCHGTGWVDIKDATTIRRTL